MCIKYSLMNIFTFPCLIFRKTLIEQPCRMTGWVVGLSSSREMKALSMVIFTYCKDVALKGTDGHVTFNIDSLLNTKCRALPFLPPSFQFHILLDFLIRAWLFRIPCYFQLKISFGFALQSFTVGSFELVLFQTNFCFPWGFKIIGFNCCYVPWHNFATPERSVKSFWQGCLMHMASGFRKECYKFRPILGFFQWS